jgi:hypothetical protein
VRESPNKTTDAHTARVEVTTARPASGGTPAATVRLQGEVDFTARRGHMLIDVSQLGLPGPPIDAVFDNTTVYTKLPPSLVPGLPADKWVKIDLATAGRSVGVDINSLSQAQASDPSQTLDYLRGAADDVTNVGTEDVRGTATTHYRAVVDLNKAAKLSPAASDAIKSTIKLLGSATQPVDVWVDSEGRVRRMQYTVDLSKTKAASSVPGAAGTVTFTLEVFDFGAPVQATVPAADQIVDLSALTGK